MNETKRNFVNADLDAYKSDIDEAKKIGFHPYDMNDDKNQLLKDCHHIKNGSLSQSIRRCLSAVDEGQYILASHIVSSVDQH